MKVCLNSIPDEVSFIDGAIVISAMSKIGLINNFHNIEDDTFRVTRCDDNVYAMRRIPGNTCIFTTNNDGRIISLSLENCWGTDNICSPCDYKQSWKNDRTKTGDMSISSVGTFQHATIEDAKILWF